MGSAAPRFGLAVSASALRKSAADSELVLAGAAACLAFWPVPIAAASWAAPAAPGYAGPCAPNTPLAGLSRIDLGEEFGPERMAIGPEGRLHAAMTRDAAPEDLQDRAVACPETTGATQTPDRLCRLSLHADAIGWLPR